MKKNIMILFTIILIIFVFSLNSAAESNYNWEQLIKNTKIQLETNKSDIVLNYTLAVAYANTGEITKCYNIIDVFGSSVSRKDFNTAVSPYLADWQDYKNMNNLLLLNYAAFKKIINKDYKNAISMFKYIAQIDPDNIWTLNHIAAALVEIKEYEQAIKYANQALSKQGNEYSHLIKGYVYYEQGNYVKTIFEAARARNLVKELADDEYQNFLE
ncbi:tetratricopeptide repeat protein [Halanaerobium praevalens]|uniref:Tetratricopeptide TPR_2 repeat protein n=1 Tax=Halanaerobium praevalens (strain ATCC 33744 / DSM 2228 / GSL) TaxID=572479 RepID=E3DLE3_HALPG|nr:tetratricopeptide repeat protein [Halanaerobium praevalens]ADO77182.1 tetratricopeptide TPR_2 repeat protein [Halanaerobium praevalens DSM 2228]